MQHQVKGRAEMLAKFNAKRKATRKPEHYDDAILLGSKGGLTRKKIQQVIGRMKKKRENYLGQEIPTVTSSDNMLFTGSKATATDVATRLSLKYLMKPLKAMKLSQESLLAFERLLLARGQIIKGTNISLRPPQEFLMLDLINSFGEDGYRKAQKVSEKLTQRGHNIQRLAIKSKLNESDVFYNVPPRAGIAQSYLGISKESFIANFPSTLRERELELEQLKKENISNKEIFIKMLEDQVKKARKSYILFRQNNM